jgi:hypothetical protein
VSVRCSDRGGTREREVATAKSVFWIEKMRDLDFAAAFSREKMANRWGPPEVNKFLLLFFWLDFMISRKWPPLQISRHGNQSCVATV